MATIEIPPRLVHETFGRLRGLRALLRSMDVGFPEAAWGEQQILEQQAQDGSVDEGEYDVESQLQAERFRFWVPRYAGYSAIIIAHSLVESQLFACVAAVQAQTGRSAGGKRRGIDRAKGQLRSLSNSDVSDDPAWGGLIDLENLRNFIVHTGGVPVEEAQVKWLTDLAAKYPSKIWVSDELYWYSRHVVVTLQCGADFVEMVDGFFRRVFPRFGFSVSGVRFVN